MKKYIKLTLVIFTAWFLIHIVLIVFDGLTDENTRSDVGVVFGNKVNPDGSLSVRLQRRLDKSIELYNDSIIGLIIVSGGLGKEGHYEGTKMHDYLIRNGIPESNIIIDNAGITTEATVENVGEMNLKINSVTVISQYYHITRAKLAFKRNGFDEVYGGHANYFELRDLYSLAREFVGYYKYYLFH